MDRHRETIDLNKNLFGVVAAAVANFGSREIKRHLLPSDFVGGGEEKRPREDHKGRMQRSRAVLMRMSTHG